MDHSMNKRINNEEDAVVELTAIFCGNGHFDHDRVLRILRDFPHLADAKFSTSNSDDSAGVVVGGDNTMMTMMMPPLACMLSCPTNAPTLSQVQAAHTLNPNAIQERHGPTKDTLLHFICDLDIHHDPLVAQFVLSNYPEALEAKNHERRTPLGSLLRHLQLHPNDPRKLPTLNIFLETLPGILEDKVRGIIPIQAALRANHGPKVLQAIAEHHPKHIQELDLTGLGRYLAPEEVDALCIVTPKLKYLACPPVSPTTPTKSGSRSNSLAKLLDCVATNQSLESLSFKWNLSSNDDDQDVETTTCESLKGLLFHNKNIKSLRIDFSAVPSRFGAAANRNDDDTTTTPSSEGMERVLRSLLNGLACNEVLEKLILRGFTFPTSFKGKALMEAASLDDDGILPTSKRRSGLRGLIFERCLGKSPIPYLPKLLSLLPPVSNLEIWEYQEERPVKTETLVQLLTQHGHRLERLVIWNRTINLEGICDCLRRSDTSLKELVLRSSFRHNGFDKFHDDLLGLLEESNTTLEEVDVGFYSKLRGVRHSTNWKDKKARIYQYLKLNKYGRRHARDPSTSLKDFVNILGNVAENDDDGTLNDFNKFMLQFDLLRAAPGTWAQAQVASR